MKKLEDISKPDPRVGLWQSPTIEALYKSAVSWSLVDKVPKKIRELWEVGQYQFIYSFYCYELVPITELFCHFSLEAAFKEIIERETGRKPKNLRSAIDQLNSIFPKIQKSEILYLKNLSHIRDFLAHPPGRMLHPWGDSRQKVMATMISGLFHFEKPRLLIPVNFLYDPLKICEPFMEPKPRHFPFHICFDACVHASRGIELIKRTKEFRVAVVFIQGGIEEPEVFTWGAQNLDLNILPGGESGSWEEYRKTREDLAIKAIVDWPKAENIFLKFAFKHEEEWYAEKMNSAITSEKIEPREIV